MGVFDFLFSGSPQPNVQQTQSSTSSTTLPPWLTQYYESLTAKAGAAGATPYTPYTGTRVAPFNADQNSAFAATKGNVGSWQPGVNAAQEGVDTAGGINQTEAGSPYLARADGVTASGAAAPYLADASGKLPDNIQDYLNPYTKNVTDRLGVLAGRNLSENLLPAVNDTFIRAGQFGGDSSRNTDFTQRAVRDTQDSLLAQQGQLLNTQYNQAGQQFQNDQNRIAGLGSTAAGAAGTDLGAASSLAGTAGTLANQTQQGQLGVANANSGLGQLRSTLGLKDAASLQNIGDTQQQQTQKGLDVNYGNFLEQRDWDKNQALFLNNAIRGIQAPTTTTTTGTQAGPGGTYAPSGLNQILGAGSALASIYGNFAKAKGGYIRPKKLARGGYLRHAHG